MKKIILLLILLLIVSCNSKKEEVPLSSYDKGVEFFTKGDLINAEKNFLEVKGNQEKDALNYLLIIYEKNKDEKNIVKTISEIEKSKEMIFKLGYSYLYGINNLPKDEKKANEIFLNGVEQNDYMSAIALGNMYEHGVGVEKDLDKAKDFYEKSNLNKYFNGTLGKNYVNFIEGLKYEVGYGVMKDIDKAKDFYKLAIDENSRDAYTRLGNIQIIENKTERHVKNGIEYLERAWTLGDKNAILSLGNIYLNGITVPKDLEKAKFYYSAGIRSKIPEAFGYMLHILVYMNTGLTVNYEEINKIAEEGSELGDGNSSKIMGYLYQNGYGIEKSEGKAEKYYLKAIEQGKLIDNLVYWYLGNLYFYGTKRIQNNEKALENYLVASEYYPASAYEIGIIFENGYGVDVDLEKAKEYYKKASSVDPRAETRYHEVEKIQEKEKLEAEKLEKEKLEAENTSKSSINIKKKARTTNKKIKSRK